MLRDEWYNRTQTKPSSSEVIVREENNRNSDYNAYLSKVFGGLDKIKISYSGGGSSGKIVVVGSNDDDDSELDVSPTKSASTIDGKLKSLFAVSSVRPSVSRSHSIREMDQPAESRSITKAKAKEESNDLSNYIVQYEMEGGYGGYDGSFMGSLDEPEEEPDNISIDVPEVPEVPEDSLEIANMIENKSDIETDWASAKTEYLESINEFINGGEEIDQPDCELLENKEVQVSDFKAEDSEDNIM